MKWKGKMTVPISFFIVWASATVLAQLFGAHRAWYCGLLTFACFCLFGACLADAGRKKILRPASLFFLFWFLQAYFSGPGLWLYHALGEGREQPFGKPFFLHPEATARILWLISAGLGLAWAVLRRFPLGGKEPRWRLEPDVWQCWVWFLCVFFFYLLGAVQAEWFTARAKVGSYLNPGSVLYFVAGLFALVAPFFFLSGINFARRQTPYRRLALSIFFLTGMGAMVLTGARVYVVGATLVFFAGLFWEGSSRRAWTCLAVILAALTLALPATHALRGAKTPEGGEFREIPLAEKIRQGPAILFSAHGWQRIRSGIFAMSYRSANVYSQEAIDQITEEGAPKIGNRNFGRLGGLLVPRILWRDKPPVDDGPERMADRLGRPRDDRFSSAPLGLTADLLERYGPLGTLVAAFGLGLGFGGTGWAIGRLLTALPAGLFMSPVFLAMPNITDASLLALINRLTYQNLRDFMLVGIWLAFGTVLLRLRQTITNPQQGQTTQA